MNPYTLFKAALKILIVIFMIQNCKPIPFQSELSHAQEYIVESDTAKLRARKYSGKGKTILLLHGGPGVPDYLEPVALELMRNGHQVITWDQRGTGLSISKNNSYTLADHEKDLNSILQYFNLKQVHLFGHSFGGLLAESFARHNPKIILSLFLSNSSIGVGSNWKNMENNVMAYNRKKSGFWGFSAIGIYSLLSMLPGKMGDFGARKIMTKVMHNYAPPGKIHPRPKPQWLNGISSTVMHQTRSSVVKMESTKWQEHYLSQNMPIQILYGEFDIYGNSKNILLKRFHSQKNKQIVLLKQSGHIPWLDQKTKFNKILTGFYK